MQYKICRVCIRILRPLRKSLTSQQINCFCFFCFICHIYPPFTRKRIVSLYFGRKVRTLLGVAFFEVYGPPVFHIKVGRPVKCLAQGHNKRTCRLVLHNLPINAERQAGKLRMPFFNVFWYDSTRGMNPRSTDCEAGALTTTPSRRFGFIEIIIVIVVWVYRNLNQISLHCQ